LSAAEREAPADPVNAALLRVSRRDFERQRKLPSDFVQAFSEARTVSSNAWEEARANDDFGSFEPHLAKMFDFAARAADLYGYDAHPYDALLYDYEPGVTTAEVKETFASLRAFTVPLVRKIADRVRERGELADPAILERPYPIEGQRAFGLKVASAFGFDFNRGRQDLAVHPFETRFSRDDVRMTTRFQENYLPDAMYSTFHETGHGLYEQNTGSDLARTPLARGASSMVHESQSRTWENLVGRSRAFWAHWLPELKAEFPGTLDDVDVDTMYRLVNRVQPSFIRVDADEVTYNLHIMLRFELELAVLEGSVKVSELPEAWNARVQEFLGITPPTGRLGILQDVHWGAGLIGYFPTYTLGNILSVQLFEAAKAATPGLEDALARADYAPLRGWLTEHVHRYGRMLLPMDLVRQATGQGLSAEPYTRYLSDKYSRLYGLD
ncbi:MAG TPA: carboxypeptidase M32, partial [Deinococcales bacterium]|nr:carboxypeptidase M32 [Deinococcales bacterium]